MATLFTYLYGRDFTQVCVTLYFAHTSHSITLHIRGSTFMLFRHVNVLPMYSLHRNFLHLFFIEAHFGRHLQPKVLFIDTEDLFQRLPLQALWTHPCIMKQFDEGSMVRGEIPSCHIDNPDLKHHLKSDFVILDFWSKTFYPITSKNRNYRSNRL